MLDRARAIAERIAQLPEREREEAIRRECQGGGDDLPFLIRGLLTQMSPRPGSSEGLTSAMRPDPRGGSGLPALPSDPASSWSEGPGGEHGFEPTAIINQAVNEFDERLERVGPYKLIKRLGEGGMGVVWLGSREDGTVSARVAIKLIRAFGGAHQAEAVIKRFELERQALGSLVHPNIARLLDAGRIAPPDGRPYLVMEYVEGEPIDEYCDRMELTIDQRIALFEKVCLAVHHAHQNLIVHRDIKPGNILVDPRGEPKLMDFGIAKVLNVGLAGVTLATREALGPMTPEYASPEQVLGKPIGTASDVYSLGVLLYHLLTGRRPYRTKERTMESIARAVAEEEPDRPSAVVTQEHARIGWDGAITTVAADQLARPRGTSTHRLRRQLSGDLDNIILMALRKSPQRRYESAAALADDLRRHRAGQPVKARGEHWGYIARKLLWRHRIVAVAAAAVMLAVVGAGGYSWLAWRSERRALAAERTAREAESAARSEAEKRLAQIRAVATSYLAGLGKRVEKLKGATESLTLLSETSLTLLENLAAEVPNDPIMQASLSDGYLQMAEALAGTRGPGQGDFKSALDMTGKAITIRRTAAISGDTEASHRLAAALWAQADYLVHQNRASEALKSLDEAVKLCESAGAIATRTLSLALLARSDVLSSLGQDAPSAADLERSFVIREAAYTAKSDDATAERDYSIALGRMARFTESRGDVARTESLLRRSLSLREARHVREPNNRTQRDLANACGALGRHLTGRGGESLAAAEPLLTRQLELLRDLERVDPSFSRAKDDVFFALVDLAAWSTARREPDRAVDRWREAAAKGRDLLSATPTDQVRRLALARVLEQLGHAENEAGETAEASIREALNEYRKLPSSPEVTRQIEELDRFLREVAN